jgi:hypothetical protein
VVPAAFFSAISRYLHTVVEKQKKISTQEVWTRLAAMYLAVAESTLATRAVKEGRPSEPGE